MRTVLMMVVLINLATGECLFADETLRGTIGDRMCGADHQGHDATKCVRECVKGGSAYVFVAGKDRILDIENQKDPKIAAELDRLAGGSVTVTGTVSKDGKSVRITALKATK